MTDTSGFYKIDPGGQLLFGPNFVTGPGFELLRENHETYTYPVEGWYWADSEAEARVLLGLPPNTSGFYKLAEDNETLLFEPDQVEAWGITLTRENYFEYQHMFPMDGWSWYDSEADARTALGLPPADPEA